MTNRPKVKHSDNAWRRKELRHGYTTSACAAACAAAGLKTLISGKTLKEIVIDLPGEKGVLFKLTRCEKVEQGILCATIKDSGDDPDITNGAEIQVYICWQTEKRITIQGGVGVGRVTRPGLAVPVGEAAINPGPRRLIERVVRDAGGETLNRQGVILEIRIPRGEALAKETLNPRLGIVGGISILGNSGILKPFSNSAYRASIYAEMKVAQANGVRKVVLTTGSRSEKYAMGLYPELPELAFIQVGDHMDFSLKQCRRLNIKSVILSGMIGKISKLAQGRMQTHVSQGLVDFAFLGRLAEKLGADEELVNRVMKANTAYHVKNMLEKANISGLEKTLTDLAVQESFKYAGYLDDLEVLMFSIQGSLLERSLMRRQL